MRKSGVMGGQAQEILFPSYEKKKLLGYAESFRDLANTFTYKIETEEENMGDRQTCLIRKKMREDREILADNLNEVARIIKSVAEESRCFYPFKPRDLKKIIHTCKENGILVRSLYQTQDEERGMRLAAEMCVDEKHVLTVEDAADLLSVLFRRKFLPEKDSLFFLSKEYETFMFEEEALYTVLMGAAKATRENEKVSGDTYTFIERGNDSIIMALSDGMGSGEKAMADSETVIDLLEKFVEAGFTKESAAEMINGVLVARSDEENMSTLDICDINLYTGDCELMKIGSSHTYIKRDAMVERIASDSLPLGIFRKIDMNRQERKLEDGNYVIMVSDGVVDGVGNEDIFKEVLRKMDMQNPQEMANYILQFVLHKTMGKVQDDMTVLTLGIWENNSLWTG